MRFLNHKQFLTMEVMASIAMIVVSALTYWRIYQTLVNSGGLRQYHRKTIREKTCLAD